MREKMRRHIVSIYKSPSTPIVAWCAWVLAVWRVGLEIINQSIVPYLSPPAYAASRDLPTASISEGLLRWMNWDGQWYRTIIEQGYIIRYDMQAGETIAFFPVFPFTVRIVSQITGLPYGIVGYLINAICVLAACFFLYKLAMVFAKSAGGNSRRQHLAGKFSVGALLISPGAFFLATFYAEPILVLCFTAATYFALQRAYWTAAIFVAVASATKISGVVLAGVLVLLWLQHNAPDGWLVAIRRHWLRLVGYCAVSASGLLAYLAYLWARFGDPLASLKNQQYWDRHAGNFLVNLWNNEYANMFDINFFGNKINYVYHLFLMLLPFLVVLAIIYALRFQRSIWMAYLGIIMLALPLVSGTLMSLNRVVLVLTPLLAAVVVAALMNRRRFTAEAAIGLATLSVAMLVLCATAFLGVYFVG